MNLSTSATWRLVLATAAWGLSFPAAKAVMLAQDSLLPGKSGMFHAALILVNRMLFSTIVMLLLLRGRMRGLTRKEVIQGIQLGLFGGIGMLLQTDAQHKISASTSAFFTQFTCVFVPLYVALSRRKAPSFPVIAAAFLVMAGCVVLNGVDLRNLRLGKGEWETILSAVLFSGQILTLERTVFHGNDMRRTATVMFAVKAAVLAPLVVFGGGISALQVYGSLPIMIITLVLTLFCTTYSYSTMVRWQPHVSATQAGLIYATEPLFTTIWALFLPGWFSTLAAISYENEHLTKSYFVGAALVLAANMIIIFAARPKPEHPI